VARPAAVAGIAVMARGCCGVRAARVRTGSPCAGCACGAAPRAAPRTG